MKAEDAARRAMLERLAFGAWCAYHHGGAPRVARWERLSRAERTRWGDVVRAVFTRFAEFEVTP